MKLRLFTILVALFSVFALSGCEKQTKIVSTPINFDLTANCDEAGLIKIKDLFVKKGLPVASNVMISVIVDSGSSTEQSDEVLRAKVKEILLKSSVLISVTEFNALGTGATATTYSASYSDDNRKIDDLTMDYGN